MERFKTYERETKNRDFKRAKFNKAPPSDEQAVIINWLKASVLELEKNHKAIETEIQILEGKDGGDTDQLEEDANTIAELDERYVRLDWIGLDWKREGDGFHYRFGF
jgi:hypothetical protein